MATALLNRLQQRFGETTGLTALDNPVLEKMAARGSCRDFANREVAPELVHTLCAVALAAPSKSDLQQRDIVYLQSRQQREKVHRLFDNDQWFKHAPVLLVICANNRRQRQIATMRDKPFANDHLDAFFNASVDAGIALSALVIAAEAVGLGCCPISILRNYADEVSTILELPEYVFPVAGLALGWPTQSPSVSMRLPLSATVHSDRFNDDHIESDIEQYDRARQNQQPLQPQREIEKYGVADHYGWSEDKARQYADPQRCGFGRFIRNRKFCLD